jgi:hypothetical protein
MAGLMVAIANSVSSNYVGVSGPSYDPAAEAFFTAEAGAGVTLTDSQKTAVNNLVVNLKAANIWTKFNAIYPIVGGTATAHKFNLVNPADTDAAFRLAFTGGWTHSATGMLPNGTNAYANTFLTPSTSLSLNNTHLSYYSRTNSTNVNNYDIGCSIVSGTAQYTLMVLRDSNLFYNAINVAQANVSSASNTDSSGFFSAHRTASNVLTGFRNSSKILTSSNVSSMLPTVSIYLGALNNAGTAQFYSIKQCAFASIGNGLTDTEAANFYTAVQAYQTTLSRNV